MINREEYEDILKQAKDSFVIPRPMPNIQTIAMSAVMIAGLIALGIAAFRAFDAVMPWGQALFVAALIESELVVGGLAMMRGNRWAIIGVVLMAVASGTYNHYLVSTEAVGAGITSGWYIAILAYSPLVAMLSLSVSLGNELRKYEEVTSEWLKQRQEWINEEVNRQTTKLERQKARQEKQQKRSDNRVAMRSETVTSSGQLPSDYRLLTPEQKQLIAQLSTSQLVQMTDISPSTARRWKRNVTANGSVNNREELSDG